MKLGKRLMERHKLAFAVAPEVVRDIVMLCTVAQSGARNIEIIIDQKIMPEISNQLLMHMADNKVHTHLFVSSDEKGGFVCTFSSGDFQMPERNEAGELIENGSNGESGAETSVLEKTPAREPEGAGV
jgi:hypothetical protein